MRVEIEHPSRWEAASLLNEAAEKIRQGIPSALLRDSDGVVSGYFIRRGDHPAPGGHK